MIYLSLALVIIACIAGWLVNKYMDINNKPTQDVGTIAALEKQINTFDQRINDTWGHISSIKQELEAFKMAIGLKGKV